MIIPPEYRIYSHKDIEWIQEKMYGEIPYDPDELDLPDTDEEPF